MCVAEGSENRSHSGAVMQRIREKHTDPYPVEFTPKTSSHAKS